MSGARVSAAASGRVTAAWARPLRRARTRAFAASARRTSPTARGSTSRSAPPCQSRDGARACCIQAPRSHRAPPCRRCQKGPGPRASARPRVEISGASFRKKLASARKQLLHQRNIALVKAPRHDIARNRSRAAAMQLAAECRCGLFRDRGKHPARNLRAAARCKSRRTGAGAPHRDIRKDTAPSVPRDSPNSGNSRSSVVPGLVAPYDLILAKRRRADRGTARWEYRTRGSWAQGDENRMRGRPA